MALEGCQPETPQGESRETIRRGENRKRVLLRQVDRVRGAASTNFRLSPTVAVDLGAHHLNVEVRIMLGQNLCRVHTMVLTTVAPGPALLQRHGGGK